MDENPYKASLVAGHRPRRRQGYIAITRILVALQVCWVAAVGYFARNESAFPMVLARVVSTGIPITIFVVPPIVLFLGIRTTSTGFLYLLLAEIAILAAMYVAVLPSVQ
jgi:hypothetical protein